MASPAQDRALAHLRALVAQRWAHPHPQLPPLHVLAAQAGVSRVTMWKAVGRLCSDGVLQRKRGGGIVVAGGHEPPAVPSRHHRRMGDRILLDLYDGHFGPSSRFPGYKALQARYGCCYRTIKRQLETLVEDGLLLRCPTGYTVPPVAGQGGFASLLLVVAGFVREGKVETLPSVQDMVRLLETECLRRALQLNVVYHSKDAGYLSTIDGSPYPLSPPRAPGRGIPMGVMLLNTGMHFNDEHFLLVRSVSQFGCPFVIVDGVGEVNYPQRLADCPRCAVYSLSSSPACGRLAGWYLRGLGHRRVAFISPYHSMQWSKNRLRGVVEAFASAGEDTSVTPVVDDSFGYESDAVVAVKDSYMKSLDSLLSKMTVSHDHLDDLLSTELRRHFDTRFFELAIQNVMGPLFQRARSLRGVTAWVCADDDVAIAAMRYLARSGLRVPADISVIGFDNSPQALLDGASTFDFDHPAAVRMILEDICREQKTGGVRVTELTGFVVPRRTTGGPPRSAGSARGGAD